MLKENIPLGIKLIWFTQVMSLAGLLVAAFNKPVPLIVGPWQVPMLITNFYLALMIVLHAAVVMDLLKLKQTAWNLLLLIESLSIVMISINFFITPEILAKINEGASFQVSLQTYRYALIPAIMIQLIIVTYILKKRPLFTE